MDDLHTALVGMPAPINAARRLPHDDGDEAAFLSVFADEADPAPPADPSLVPQMPMIAMASPNGAELAAVMLSGDGLRMVGPEAPLAEAGPQGQAGAAGSLPVPPDPEVVLAMPVMAANGRARPGAAMPPEAAAMGKQPAVEGSDVPDVPTTTGGSGADRARAPLASAVPAGIGHATPEPFAPPRYAGPDPQTAGQAMVRITARPPATGGVSPAAALPAADRAEALLGAAGMALQPGHSAAPERPLAADLPQQTLRQIATALSGLSQGPGAAVDIALDPPELGRVRLSLMEVNGAMTLSITTERPETADLIRRHLVLLTDEFARQGLDAPSVDISGGHARGQGARDRYPVEPADRPVAEEAVLAAVPLPSSLPRQGVAGGLDLRL